MSRCIVQRVLLCSVITVGLGGRITRGDEPSHNFARYQIVVDRAPFGALNAAADNAPQPSFSANYTFVGIAKDDSQPLLAIIQDKAGNRTFFKAEGEAIGDITVVKIEKTDKAQVKLVLKQGIEVATLAMETKTSVGPAPAVAQPAMPGIPPGPTGPQPGVRRIPFRRGG